MKPRNTLVQALVRAYVVANRVDAKLTYEEYSAREVARDAVRARTKAALRSGKITKPACCEACTDKCELQAHHTDYAKPLEVVFLCARCHARLHELAPQTHVGQGFHTRLRRERAVASAGRNDPYGQGFSVPLDDGGSLYFIDGEPDDLGDVDARNALEWALMSEDPELLVE